MDQSSEIPLPVILALVAVGVLIVMVAVVVTITSTRSYRPIAAERERAERLASGGLRVVGRVTSRTARPGGRAEAPAMQLHVRFSTGQATYETELSLIADQAFVAQFAPGAEVHLLADPDDPTQVAVDRDHHELRLPRGR